MSAVSRLLARVGKLPPAETYRVRSRATCGRRCATARCCWATTTPRATIHPARRCSSARRTGAPALGVLYGRIFAERGFQVFIQSVRGTFGSGGTFDPFRQEHDDGLDTVAWIRQQPWFTGASSASARATSASPSGPLRPTATPQGHRAADHRLRLLAPTAPWRRLLVPRHPQLVAHDEHPGAPLPPRHHPLATRETPRGRLLHPADRRRRSRRTRQAYPLLRTVSGAHARR